MTFTSVAAAMLHTLVTEKVVMWLRLSILWGKTLEEWVILLHNYIPGIVHDECVTGVLNPNNQYNIY
jgi:hypothetical protein